MTITHPMSLNKLCRIDEYIAFVNSDCEKYINDGYEVHAIITDYIDYLLNYPQILNKPIIWHVIDGNSGNYVTIEGSQYDSSTISPEYLVEYTKTHTDNDTITASGLSNLIVNYTGNNHITANTNRSTIYGGYGNETVLVNGSYNEVLIMDGENYVSVASDSNYNSIYGGDSEDTIKNSGKYSLIHSSIGDDYIENSSTDYRSTIFGGLGNDTIVLSNDNQIHYNLIAYYAGDGNDVIKNFGTRDTLVVDGVPYTMENSGKDLHVKIGDEVIVLEGMSGQSVHINGVLDSFEDSSGSIGSNDVTRVIAKETVEASGTDISTTPSSETVVVQYITQYVTVVSGDLINIENSTINNSGVLVIGSDNSVDAQVNNYSYVYSGNDVVVRDYAGEQINLKAEFRGINFDDSNFYVLSSTGQLEIQNARDKFINYGDATGNPIAFSYLASDGKTIDGRTKNTDIGVMIGGNNSDNQIYAGDGGSSMWGGVGGNDTLTGAEGYDEIFYVTGSGNDVITNGRNENVTLNAGEGSDTINGWGSNEVFTYVG